MSGLKIELKKGDIFNPKPPRIKPEDARVVWVTTEPGYKTKYSIAPITEIYSKDTKMKRRWKRK